jgi:hypothetical protein
VNFNRKQIIRRYLHCRALTRMGWVVSEFQPSFKQLALCCVD